MYVCARESQLTLCARPSGETNGADAWQKANTIETFAANENQWPAMTTTVFAAQMTQKHTHWANKPRVNGDHQI